MWVTEDKSTEQRSSIWQRQDFQSAVIRFAIWVFALLYIGLAARFGRHDVDLTQFTTLFIGYFFFFLVFLTSVLLRPEWPQRRMLTLVVDISATTACIYLTGDGTSPFFLIYIWIFISYGTRYGEVYLKYASLLSAAAYFFILLVLQQLWEKPFDSLFIILSLLLLPYYQLVLLRKLHRLRLEAIHSSQAKSRFLGKMTQELQSPLNGILGVTQLMERGELAPAQRRFLRAISTSADMLRARIGDAIDLSQLDADRLQLDIHEFDLQSLVREVCDGMAQVALDSGQELMCSIEPDVPLRIHSDFNRLKQILFNLLDNAVKFGTAGQIEIRLSLLEHSHSSYLRIDIFDNGDGVPQELQGLIFSGTQSKIGLHELSEANVGLGLTIVHQLCQLMSIDLMAKRLEEGGNRISLALPLRETVLRQAPQPLPDLHGRKVFLFERNLKVLAQIEGMLGEMGIICRSTSHISRLASDITLLEREGVDFAIIADSPERQQDLQRIADLIREHLDRPVPVIFLGFSSRELGHEYPASLFLSKPVLTNELARTIQQLISGDVTTVENTVDGLSQIRVLVAEDNQISGMILSTLLNDLGHDVYWAKDGQEALDVALADEFDLAVVDLRMPRMDGLTFAQQYRRREKAGRHMPIFALTAHGTQEVRDKSQEVGIDAFLHKPVDRQVLSSAIQDHVGA